MITQDYINGYQAGYADKSANKTTLYPVGPTDLAPLLSAAIAAKTSLVLTKGDYTYTGNVSFPDGFVLDGNGSSLVAHEVAGSYAIFHLAGKGSGFKNFVGITGTSTAALVLVQADSCSMVNCKAINGFTRACECQPLGTNFTFDGNETIQTYAMSLYSVANNTTVSNNNLGPSVGESPLRFDVGTSGIPSGANIVGNTITNDKNSMRKPAVQLRMLLNFNFSDNKVYGSTRYGQIASQTSSGAITATGKIAGNTFVNPNPGCNPIMIDEGCQVAVIGNIFDVSVNTMGVGCISIAKSGAAFTSKNVQQITKGQTAKPLCGTSSQGKHTTDSSDTIAII